MKVSPAAFSALANAGLSTTIVRSQPLTGGCIHTVLRLTLDDGADVVAKITAASNRNLFEQEAASLRALAATNTVVTPHPLAISTDDDAAVLLLTALEPAGAPGVTDATWSAFGRQLAALHAVDVGSRYGFDHDNHLGTTPQPNGWCESWVQFNAQRRLGHQLHLLREVLRDEERACIQRVIDSLDQLIPARPKPALLHGDLWSGNALAAAGPDGELVIAVLDPACSVGDGWADIAMMRLFGGFPESCLNAYREAAGDADRVETRIAVYQLYHVLNHITIFGRGYVSQALNLAKSLV